MFEGSSEREERQELAGMPLTYNVDPEGVCAAALAVIYHKLNVNPLIFLQQVTASHYLTNAALFSLLRDPVLKRNYARNTLEPIAGNVFPNDVGASGGKEFRAPWTRRTGWMTQAC